MKVRLEKEEKKYITLAEAPIVREIINDMKEDENTAAFWAEMAVRVAAYNYKLCNIEILKASAKIARNARACNVINDHSADFDVWIDAMAYVKTCSGSEFIIIGFCVSDLWVTTSDNGAEIASNMYIRRFKEVE